MNRLIVSLFLSMSLMSVQACTSFSEHNVIKTNSSSHNGLDSSMPKEFGSRFSTENIKAEREAFYAIKRQELRRMDPAADANRALRTNNIHLMAVPAGRGGTSSFPGLVEPQVLTVSCKTKAVQGMGDTLYGKNHILYRQELLQYMRKFNALMASYCK